MILNALADKNKINPPIWLPTNTQFVTVMGSHAYGVADTSIKSSIPDMDLYGFCIPPKNQVFPHLVGEIAGFGTPNKRFNQWQQAHVFDEDAHGGKGQEYDFQIFNIVKYFELCRQGNPNMLDSLFTREECVLHCTDVGRMVRDNRKLFVSKEIWPKMRGYAFSQMHKMRDKNFDGALELQKILEFESAHHIDRKTPREDIAREMQARGSHPSLTPLTDQELHVYYDLYTSGLGKSKRFEIHKFHGYDCKFAYHIIRLLDQCQQILETGEMDLQRAKEAMKSIRRGEWTMERILQWAESKEKELDIAFTNCKLPIKADENKLKKILMQCLEHHYGSISDAIQQPDWARQALLSIDEQLTSVRQHLYHS